MKQGTNQAARHDEQGAGVGDFIRKYGIVLVLLLMIATMCIIKPKEFATWRNATNVAVQTSLYGIIALGMTLVIISKGIDLGAGSVLALAGVFGASFAQTSGAMQKVFPEIPELPWLVPILATLALGALCGFINGALVAKTGIPAFIATLGMFTVARGLALIYSGGRPIGSLIPGFTFLGGGRILGGWIPMPMVVWFAAIAVTWVLLGYTSFGKSVYAIGGNIKAAEVSGLAVGRNLILVYTFCGLMCGLAAVVFAGRVATMHPGAAVGYELTAIAATTIGGTSHSGGIGTIWGAVVGALILGVLRNSLTLLNVHAYWQQVVEGVIIVVAVIIDMHTHTSKK